MKGFSGMEDKTAVELQTNASILIVEGEEMQNTASSVSALIEGDMNSAKESLNKMSADSVSCWNDSNGEEFRNGVSELISKFDSVAAQLLEAAREYQSFGAESVQTVEDNASVIRSSI